MGLRDFLLNMKAVNEATGGFASSAQGFRETVAKEQLQKELPDIIANKKLDRLAALSQAAGDEGINKVIATYMAQNLMPKPSTVSGDQFSKPQLEAMGITDPKEQAAVMSARPETTKDIVGGIVGKKTREAEAEAERRRQEGADTAVVEKFSAPIEKKEALFDDAKSRIEAALDQFKSTPNRATLQGLAVAFAKGAGDAGVLSNQDLSNYRLSTIAQDFASLEAYATNQVDDNISPEISDAMIKMGENALRTGEDRKRKVLRTAFGHQINKHGERLSKGGKKNASVLDWENTLGVKAEKGKDGRWKITGEPEEIASGQAAKDIAETINTIRDPGVKAQAMKDFESLSKMSGGTISEKNKQIFLQNLKKHGGV